MEKRKAEAIRYLGYGRSIPDSGVNALIDASFAELDRIAKRASVYRVFPVEVTKDAVLFPEGIAIESRGLARHMQGCDRAALLAATLGAGVEQALVRYGRTELAKASVFHACCNAFIEEVCDSLCAELEGELIPEGYAAIARFSPGYGDFPLEYQRMITRILRSSWAIGLTVTPSLTLLPSKSVTAVMGFRRGMVHYTYNRCRSCESKGCAYRKDEDA